MPILRTVKQNRFHGRHEGGARQCERPGCDNAGEYRAPGVTGSSFDGPGEYRWLCLEHIREFNAAYDWFAGMSSEEILAEQSPAAGWRTESPAFRPTAGIADLPRWADFDDPLDAISARAGEIRQRAQKRAQQARQAHNGEGAGSFSPDERRALDAMGLGPDTDRQMLRRRYSQLVRRYHPDRNGGDRSHEARLAKVVEAYQLLRKASGLE